MTKKNVSAKKKWLLGGVLGVILALAGASTAYAAHFSDVALPGVSVAGTSVTGMTESQVAQMVAERAEATEVITDVEGTTTTGSLGDLGITVDAQATAKRALEQSSSVIHRFTAPFKKSSVDVVYSVDETVLEAFSKRVTELVATPVQDAEVRLADSGDYFVATQSNVGAAVDIEVLDAVANDAARTLESQQVLLELQILQPNVTSEQAQQVATQANELLGVRLVLYGTVSVNAADTTEIAQWISFPASNEGLASPSFDSEKITSWVKQTAEATNDEPVDGIQNVDSSGKVLATPAPGTPGLVANNVDELAAQAVTALSAGQSFDGKLTYEEVQPRFEQRPVVAGANGLAYSPHAGEKWIDIDLTKNTVTAYEGASPVKGPVLMVHGMPGAETVTGTYPIYLKYEQQTMRGTRPDGSKYETEDVPWVMYFHGGYALHGAYWRSTFGYAGEAGSNGCINIPVEVSKWFYDWSELGTPVVSHY